MEEEGLRDFAHYQPLVAGRKAYEAYQSGNFEQGILSLGPAVAFANAIAPVQEILGQMLEEAAMAQRQLQGVCLRCEPNMG